MASILNTMASIQNEGDVWNAPDIQMAALCIFLSSLREYNSRALL